MEAGHLEQSKLSVEKYMLKVNEKKIVLLSQSRAYLEPFERSTMKRLGKIFAKCCIKTTGL